MKRALFLLTFTIYILSTSNAFGRCMGGNVWSNPSSATILPSNASVIITFFGSERDAFKKKGQKKFFFKSGKQKVEATLVQEWDSEFGLKALRFKATQNLKVGKTYSLRVNGKKFSWKIGSVDTTKPKWVKHPKMTEFKKVEMGCGPSINFLLTLDVSDDSPVYYDVVMKTKAGKKQHFFVIADEDGLRLGHGMCSGEFVPPQGSKVHVEMTPYDFAGNKGETKSITLTSK